MSFSDGEYPPTELDVVREAYEASLFEDIVIELATARDERDEARRSATHDSLTGLHNARGLVETLQQLDERDTRFGVLFVDVDKFKPINDIHGHEVGDQFLRGVALAFRGAVRESDFVASIARPGGDEYVIVVAEPDEDAREVTHGDYPDRRRTFSEEGLRDGLGQRLRNSFAALQASDPERRFDKAGISIGVAIHEAGMTADDVVAVADERMYEDKISAEAKMPLRKRVAARAGMLLLRYADVDPPR